ncbi:MAG: HlyD family secretion protein [Spirochaetales bacterium]|nr:HlyD family secretion protein [Spirochaetales bacterium]
MSSEVTKKPVRKGPRVVANIIVTAVLVAGCFYGYLKISDMIKYVSTDDASIKSEQYKMSSRLMGRISRIDVEEGDMVQARSELVFIDDRDLRAQETQAQSALVLARKNLELSRINLERSRSDYNRILGLYNNNAATKESYDHAASALNSAQAQYDVGLAQVDASRAQIGVIETQLQNSVISTPLGGTVNTISLTEGDIAQPGQTILTVNDLDDIWIIANIKETEISRIKVGAEVEITVDALRKTPFKGQVEEIYAGIVPPAFQIGEFTKTTQRIPVRIGFSDTPDGDALDTRLLPGMSAEVKVARSR